MRISSFVHYVDVHSSYISIKKLINCFYFAFITYLLLHYGVWLVGSALYLLSFGDGYIVYVQALSLREYLAVSCMHFIVGLRVI